MILLRIPLLAQAQTRLYWRSLVRLDGSGSSHAERGSAPILSSETVSTPTFTAGLAGAYELSLIVGNGTNSSSSDTVTIMTVNPAPIPDTGQTKCYQANGTEIPCAGSGQDAAYNTGNQQSYTDNDDETITDNVTGLMWQKCTLGQSGADCSMGTLLSYTWYRASGTDDFTYNSGGAVSACGDLTLAGHSDWRLPTDFELMTLVDYSVPSPVYAINAVYFPGTLGSLYWSSPVYADPFDDIWAWNVKFSFGGSMGSSVKTSLGRVRCVRGEPLTPFLIDNGDGTVTDLAGSLMWQMLSEGTKKTWLSAISYCESLPLGGLSGWRLPNIRELRSIVDTAKWSPALDQVYFEGAQPYPYWTSTTDASLTDKAWAIDFKDGSTVRPVKGGGNYVRCVRGR